ncbi:alcohol dehydrogenase catalytic domain-containing protein [Nonomuraea rubra]|uniref:alcohol dehydrogenase catalytic domain-containing protein n=1 Tax=Nonomuraea rubra TaxID=46180 RepID=UPI00360EEB02
MVKLIGSNHARDRPDSHGRAGQPAAQRPPRPRPGAGQILVRARAIGVSYAETQIRAGALPFPLPLPAVIGAEVAGEVVEVGEGVPGQLIGNMLVGVTGGLGAYAEYVLLPAAMACPVPDGLTPEQALAGAAPGALALALLHKAALSGGGTVLVEAGASSVGAYLVRHAKEFGAGHVIATAGTPAKRERAAELGADTVLDHNTPAGPPACRTWTWPSRRSAAHRPGRCSATSPPAPAACSTTAC